MGIRSTRVHLTPSVDVLNTRSFDAHFLRKRQSAQTTYTLPEASTSAESSEAVNRRFPATSCAMTRATVRAVFQLAPPSVDRKAMIREPNASEAGTITVP